MAVKLGSKVSWTYEHHLNRKSSIWITRVGYVVQWKSKDSALRNKGGKKVKVHFHGNKNPSIIPYNEAKEIFD